ncbi:MAG: hypothetical protein ACK5UG_00050 [Synechococcaceae cyanobacterium]
MIYSPLLWICPTLAMQEPPATAPDGAARESPITEKELAKAFVNGPAAGDGYPLPRRGGARPGAGRWFFLVAEAIVGQMGGPLDQELRRAVYASCLDASFAGTGAWCASNAGRPG